MKWSLSTLTFSPMTPVSFFLSSYSPSIQIPTTSLGFVWRRRFSTENVRGKSSVAASVRSNAQIQVVVPLHSPNSPLGDGCSTHTPSMTESS
ncbi:hypothetical protein HN51_003956 [Arachis hypogaea]